MHYIKFITLSVFFTVLLLTGGCDKGIEPRPADEIPGFGGRITFIGAWPDSIQRSFVVVFENPLETLGDINISNLKFISSEIPFGVATYDYDSRDSALIHINPGTFSYVAVVQQSTPQPSLNPNDWIVAGIYYAYGDTTHPGKLVIPEKTFVKNIDIRCNFNNPPPQPTGGG
jgi:hypothetical protein